VCSSDLRASKRDVMLHVERHCLDFADDPSNQNPAFLRVRVRREAMPLLQSLSPQVVRHLNALADALSDAELPSFDELEAGLAENAELNGAQIREALRARRLGRSVAIRVAGGKDLQTRSRPQRPAKIKA